jgi:integrase
MLALEVGHLVGNVLQIRQNLYNRKIVLPKIDAGIRDIDLAPELAEMLRVYIGNRTSGFIFRTRKGGPLLQRNVLRVLHSTLARMKKPKLGFHAFRRFRVTHLRKNRVVDDLIKIWIGHAPQTVTNGYAKLKEDIQFRTNEVERVGLGFELGVEMFPAVPQICTPEVSQVV